MYPIGCRCLFLMRRSQNTMIKNTTLEHMYSPPNYSHTKNFSKKTIMISKQLVSSYSIKFLIVDMFFLSGNSIEAAPGKVPHRAR